MGKSGLPTILTVYQSMKISIALATHNGCDYLEKQLESLLRQTLPPVEIIISDDGSTDGTWEILDGYCKNHRNIRVIHSNFRGINANFQNAISACRGDFIALCDQDDVWKENKLEKLVARFTDRVLLVYGKSVLVDHKGRQLSVPAEDYLEFHSCRSGHIPLYFLFSNCISGHAMMIRRKLVDYALPFPGNCIYDHWLALIASAKSDIVFATDAITYHRIHTSNAANNQEKNRREKRLRPKPSKCERFTRQQSTFYLRLKKAITEGDDLAPAERDYLARLLDLTLVSEDCFFNFQLFFLLWRRRHQLFHGNLLRECRNRALGRNYYKLLDSLSKRREL